MTCFVRFKRLTSTAQIPTQAHPGDSGLDLYADILSTLEIPAGLWSKVPTGVAAQIPSGFEGQVRPRSGLANKFGLTVLNSPGTIDSGYRGRIDVLLYNASPWPVTIKGGDRIAQLCICPVASPIVQEELGALEETGRGVNGFGSSGL